MALAIDCHDREVPAFLASPRSLTGADIRTLMDRTLWARFGEATLKAPHAGEVTVSTDVLSVTGSVHVVTRCARTLPGDPCQIHVNLVGVQGEGQTTGLRYVAVGAGFVELPPNPIVPVTLLVALLPVGTPGVPPNPILPDELMRVSLQLEFDAAGTLLSVEALASTFVIGED